jgi:hypothetical protein
MKKETIEVGDLVERIRDDWHPLRVGYQGTVICFDTKSTLSLREYPGSFDLRKFKLIKKKHSQLPIFN